MAINAADKATELGGSDPVHVDVLIVGAGISGIGAAWHLLDKCPERSFTILEAKESFGGTWETHKYPGIRSDSDLFTFGYHWKPWEGAPIATAEEILRYLGEVIEENELDQYIRYGYWISNAACSRDQQLWHLEATEKATGATRRFTCNFLWMCQGYYRHDGPYTPEWAGMDEFKGDIIHPQTWPEGYDYTGKRMLVIGSGATAATIVPAMADTAAHVTMLQRSPTYFAPGLNRNELADNLRELDIPKEWIHEIVRQRINLDQANLNKRSREEPEAVRAELLEMAKEFLGEDFDYDTHFNPSYRPWQQRLAFIPDGDMFKAIAEGKASVVTDQIDRFTEKGVLLKSGELLEADVIVTATGFNLSVMGDIAFSVDGEPVDFADTVSWRGMMFTDVPNMVWVFGYFRASWTQRADLIGELMCRLFKEMDAKGFGEVVPRLPTELSNMPKLPWVDPENFNPGYLQRSMHLLPKQGDRDPWIHQQDFPTEAKELPNISFDDGALNFAAKPRSVQSAG